MPSTMRARGGLLALLAAVYVAYLVRQAPHTVHHFFEHDAETQNECALNASAERVSATTVDLVNIAPVSVVEPPIPVVAPALVPRRSLAVLGPRAPPHPAA
jgi:hypothetical protein